MTRVLLAEATAWGRDRALGAISRDAELELAGTARDGREAIARCLHLRPHVIAVGWDMPGALELIEHVMAYCPTPILVLAPGEAPEAIAAGAVDVLSTPAGHEAGALWQARFLAALKIVARIKVITHPRRKLGRKPASRAGHDLVAIGASTGGPSAVLAILRALPADFPLPILLVVHLHEAHGQTFAGWLDGQLPFPVRQAKDDEPLPAPGTPGVLVAPPDRHLEVAGDRLRLSSAPPRQSCRPAIDVLFESIARERGAGAIACLLTGMGRDGAEGLLAIRRAGGLTIAQDEATSVVYGMPREAARLEAANLILPLGEISGVLVARGTRQPGRSP